VWTFASFDAQVYENHEILLGTNSLEFRTMFRILTCAVAFAALVSIGTLTALAQSPTPKPKSPAAIAAASRLLAEKNESCRQQAKQQGLRLLKRRRFMRDCRAGR